MRPVIAALPLAALSLSLAACGETISVEDIDEAELQAQKAPALEMAEAESIASEEDDFIGAYTRTDADGATSQLVLNADDTYEFTDADGSRRSGRFSREDGGRLTISAFSGGTGFFLLRDGSLVELDAIDQPEAEATGDVIYVRDAAEDDAPAAAPAAAETPEAGATEEAEAAEAAE
ncbi:hypothetical protein [Paraurantiacibacter namhicola]|uniref:Uncharacterized protein n=1 Tax=Paraurantiacibacter namhicola TaxID=645517 RepID=A0A1C7D693_9SPHN|nr:hypothetical protein [Paraurantiacibacter namhicola]ANU06977.1 hypothetical protein A6F65_00655 [Paraurantiacibacter namhicola]